MQLGDLPRRFVGDDSDVLSQLGAAIHRHSEAADHAGELAMRSLLTTASSESPSPEEQEQTGNARPSVATAAFNHSATNLLETSSGRDFDIARATKA